MFYKIRNYTLIYVLTSLYYSLLNSHMSYGVMVFELVLDTMGFGGCFRYLLGGSDHWPCMMFAKAVTRVTEDKAIIRPFHKRPERACTSIDPQPIYGHLYMNLYTIFALPILNIGVNFTTFTSFGNPIWYCLHLYLFRLFLHIRRQDKPSPYQFLSGDSGKSTNLLQKNHRYFIWTTIQASFYCFILSFPIPFIRSLLSEGPMDSSAGQADFVHNMGASPGVIYIGVS